MSVIRASLEKMPPASLSETRLPLGNLASGGEIAIPVVLARGARPGPCLWINGQVHGDELNGVFAALDFIRSLPLTDLSGSVVVTATANPQAFDARRKRSPADELDLDQTFPGNPRGLATERAAAALAAAVDGCADAMVSMHTMGTPFECPPFAVYKLPDPPTVDEAVLLRLMAQFRPDVACWMPIHMRPGELPGHLAGAIDYQMLLAGKPAFMIELGAGGRCTPEHVRQGIDGLLGTARVLGLLPGMPVEATRIIKVERYQHVTCDRGGLFRALAAPGSDIPPGATYGEVLDPYGRRIETVSAPGQLRLVGVRRDPLVHSGDRVAFVAHEWREIKL